VVKVLALSRHQMLEQADSLPRTSQVKSRSRDGDIRPPGI
jgi:hypothetical protein